MLACARDTLGMPFDVEFFGEYEAAGENIFVLRKRAETSVAGGISDQQAA
jgi:hypothetical protein